MHSCPVRNPRPAIINSGKLNAELTDLGLTPFFTQQLSGDELEQYSLARVTEVQRSHIIVSDGIHERSITLGSTWYQQSASRRPTVGDWVLLNHANEKIQRLLKRKSVFRRVAAGTRIEVQLIAANIDTLFIVTSCNEEFEESRLERYLALAAETNVDPVIILTKADLADEAESYRERVRAIGADLPVEIVNALDVDSLSGTKAWVRRGSTVALVGSSGVGKSTLVNSLAGRKRMDTGSIREQDAKGRHTTSYRSLHRLPGGGLLLDVPGMRELKVAELDTALAEVFSDIDSLAEQCRFRDCDHNDEPGCAVRAAVASGDIDARRLRNYRKLVLEESRNTASIAEQRQRDRQFGKSIKAHLDLKRQRDTAR
ncbi:MAG: ribosome small subunit-dependent GTPase A [Gammaproteobacteria bacterium]|nr:ribosome small subunit-dependent GTPase A [Gammaproteobacteria bacterium]